MEPLEVPGSQFTLQECEQKFAEICENNVTQFTNSKDKLSLQRSCVELLNRLEGTNHRMLAGRILIFLARILPYFDQSGVNFRAEFNNRELPPYILETLKQLSQVNLASAEKKASNDNNGDSQDMEEGETLSDDEEETLTQASGDKFFEKFWKLQRLLNQPNLLFDKNHCYTFRACCDSIMSQMELRPAKLIKVWRMNTSYMSNPKALTLQLNDINMRRCLLVQMLIVIQYLDAPHESRPESFNMDKTQQAWFSSMTKRIFSLLEMMPNQEEGRKFLGLVRHILRREEMWIRWKAEKCKEPEKPVESEELLAMRGTYHKRRKISDELSAADAYKMHVIGSQDMSRLWNMKPNDKFNTPNLNKYLDIPEAKRSEYFKDPNYSFRVLRLLRKSPHFFEQTTRAIVSSEEYLATVAPKHRENKRET